MRTSLLTLTELILWMFQPSETVSSSGYYIIGVYQIQYDFKISKDIQTIKKGDVVWLPMRQTIHQSSNEVYLSNYRHLWCHYLIFSYCKSIGFAMDYILLILILARIVVLQTKVIPQSIFGKLTLCFLITEVF